MQNFNQDFKETISLSHVAYNQKFPFKVDHNIDWVRDLLTELNEGASFLRPQDLLKHTWLRVHGEISKENHSELGNILLLNFEIEAKYATDCVKTLRPLQKELNFSCMACSVDQGLAEQLGYLNDTETFVSGKVYQLYFHERNVLNFKELLHEQIFLNKDPYPVHADQLEDE